MLKSKNIGNYLKYFSTLINEIKVIKCDDGFYEVKDAMSKISKLGIHVNPSKMCIISLISICNTRS